jgi:hypothetical protein
MSVTDETSAGIDWAKDSHAVCVIDGVNPQKSWRVPLCGFVLSGFGHVSLVVDG